MKRSRGFTLIEVMMVGAILGILSSIAIPAINNVLLKSKRSEIPVHTAKMLNGMKDYLEQHERFPTGSAAASALVGAYNPPAPLSGKKKAFVKGGTGWHDIGYEPDGFLYGHYTISGTHAPGVSTVVTVVTETDLDYDGRAAVYTLQQELIGGAWVTTLDKWSGDDW